MGRIKHSTTAFDDIKEVIPLEIGGSHVMGLLQVAPRGFRICYLSQTAKVPF
jgi:hypothetical protein